MENMFSASGSQARQLLDQQKPVGHRAPTPGDRLGDEPWPIDHGPWAMGQSVGKLTVSVKWPQADEPDERDIKA